MENILKKGATLLFLGISTLFVVGCCKKNDKDCCECQQTKSSCVKDESDVVTIETDENFKNEIKQIEGFQNALIEEQIEKEIEKEETAEYIAQQTVAAENNEK